MSFEIEYSEKMIVATFNGEISGSHIIKAFVEVTENGNIEDLNHIIFDYTNITSFTTVTDFVKITKTFTKFSVDWNKNISAITVTTNTNLQNVITEVMKHKKKLIWNYMLFENLNDALKWCSKNE